VWAVLRHGAKKLTSVISCCERNCLKLASPSFSLSLLSAWSGLGVGLGPGLGLGPGPGVRVGEAGPQLSAWLVDGASSAT
jgi:hypothetical protein